MIKFKDSKIDYKFLFCLQNKTTWIIINQISLIEYQYF
jgi:hypothetical protein